MIQLCEAKAFSHTHQRMTLRATRRRNSTFQLLVILCAISSAVGRVEEIPSYHEPVRDRLRGSRKNPINTNIQTNMDDANTASSQNNESNDLPTQHSRVLNLSKIASGGCYIIRSSVTHNYLSIKNSNGNLFSTKDYSLARTFCVFNDRSDNKYKVTVKNEDGSNSFIKHRGGGLTTSESFSRLVRFAYNEHNESYILKFGEEQWADKGENKKLVVINPTECPDCSYKFELLSPSKLDANQEEVRDASFRTDVIDVLDSPRYPNGVPP